MFKIEIDKDVYVFLQKSAQPFEDTPNTVLRRILLEGNSGTNNIVLTANIENRAEYRTSEKKPGKIKITDLLQQTVGQSDWIRVGRQRNLYENEKERIYVLRFDKSKTPNLWFRIPPIAYDLLTETRKKSYFLFVNQADRYFFQVPMSDLDKKVSDKGIAFLPETINIDPAKKKLRELDWDISAYFKDYS